jgi:DNA-binding SARP family transcriptional activator/TolB-like protein
LIRLTLLGAVDLVRPDEVPVRSILAQPKRLALLAYLAAARPEGYHRRDTLATLLWPDMDDRRARANLRKGLHRIRKSLGDDVLLTRGDDEVAVDPDRLWCDVRAFRASSEAAQAEPALELYAGPLMPGFHLDGTSPFMTWLDRERRELRRAACRVAALVARGRLDAGNGPAALQAAERAARLDPLSEQATRVLMVTADTVGERARALAAFERLASTMERELEAEPSAETRSLADEIRARERKAAPSPAGEARGDPPVTPGKKPTVEPSRGRWPAAALAVLALVAAAWFGTRAPAASPEAPRASLLVRPFQPATTDSLSRILAQGLTVDLLARLGDVEGVRVARGSAAAPAEAIFTGTVQRQDARVRVTARVADGATGEQLWATALDRPLDDVLGLQAELASLLATALEWGMGRADMERLTRIPTTRSEAWVHLQRARAELFEPGRAFRQSARIHELLDRAIALDPGLAEAWALKAILFQRRVPRDVEWADSTLAAAERAVALDPGSGVAQTALAFGRYLTGAPPARVAEAFVRAVEASPGEPLVARGLSVFYQWVGRVDRGEAWKRWEAALEPDAGRPVPYPWTLWVLGRTDEAAARWEELALLYPADWRFALRLAHVELTRGRTDRAWAALERGGLGASTTGALVALAEGDCSEVLRQLRGVREELGPALLADVINGVNAPTLEAHCLAVRGDTVGARRRLDEARRLREAVRDFAVLHRWYDEARARCIEGDVEGALAAFETAVAEGWLFVHTYMGEEDPILEPIRDHPRFQAALERARARMRLQWERVQELPEVPSLDDLESMIARLREDRRVLEGHTTWLLPPP